MLKDSILKFLKLDGFIESLTGYVETRVELLKVEVREDVARSMAKVSIFFLIAFSVVVFILFLSIALALWLAMYTGMVAGFAIVAVLYLLLAWLFVLFKDSIRKNIERKLLDIVKKK
jgi:uncharacterized membrane protein YqjE